MAAIEAVNLFTLLLTASTNYGASGALLCTPDPRFPGCICVGKSFRLDISQILPYPYSLYENTRTDLNYSFSPCNLIQCQNTPEVAAVCQSYRGMYEYNCGLIANWTVYSTDPQNFSVVYSRGTNNRQTTVWFYQDKNATANSASSVVESPTLYYAFSVRFNIDARPSTSRNSMLLVSMTSNPQDFETSIAFPVGLAFGLLAGLVVSTSALLVIIVVYRRKRGSGRTCQMGLGTSATNSIKKGGTLLSVKNDVYELTVPAGESSHVRLSKPHAGDPPAIVIKPNMAYGMINIASSSAGT